MQETMALAVNNHYLKGGVMMPEGQGNPKSVGFISRLVDPVRSTSPVSLSAGCGLLYLVASPCNFAATLDVIVAVIAVIAAVEACARRFS